MYYGVEHLNQKILLSQILKFYIHLSWDNIQGEMCLNLS